LPTIDPDLLKLTVVRAILGEVLGKLDRIDLTVPVRAVVGVIDPSSTPIHVLVVEEHHDTVRHGSPQNIIPASASRSSDGGDE
jgi:hypothetical protein